MPPILSCRNNKVHRSSPNFRIWSQFYFWLKSRTSFWWRTTKLDPLARTFRLKRMLLILAATTDRNLVMVVEMGGSPSHGPKVNRVEVLPREEIWPIKAKPLPQRLQISRTREKLPFNRLLLNWTCATTVDQMIIGHKYTELPRGYCQVSFLSRV